MPSKGYVLTIAEGTQNTGKVGQEGKLTKALCRKTFVATRTLVLDV